MGYPWPHCGCLGKVHHARQSVERLDHHHCFGYCRRCCRRLYRQRSWFRRCERIQFPQSHHCYNRRIGCIGDLLNGGKGQPSLIWLQSYVCIAKILWLCPMSSHFLFSAPSFIFTGCHDSRDGLGRRTVALRLPGSKSRSLPPPARMKRDWLSESGHNSHINSIHVIYPRIPTLLFI